jgi:hypothetical protein
MHGSSKVLCEVFFPKKGGVGSKTSTINWVKSKFFF